MLFCTCYSARAAHEASKDGKGTGWVAPASNEGEQAIPKFRVAPGLKVSLWAAEPMLANPVALCFDEKGRCYVAETFRIDGQGVLDIRGFGNWLDDDLACRTVEDRAAVIKKQFGEGSSFTNKFLADTDRISLLEDRSGSGRADHATVFAENFRDQLDGLGSGVLARKGNVWFTCIPDLWLLRDTKGTGTADARKSLSHGYGVHFSFMGHDLHGLRMGPDGKIYFSIGDRGLHVKTHDGRTLDAPDTGSVLRCYPDGSALEIFATGLRNPQDLVFDQYGNLFTGDNNCDSGDAARWVYVVEGGDSGWRVGFQHTPRNGPWNVEKLWHLQWPGQAAFILPPVAHISSGPSGNEYYPGVGLPDRYNEHFFLVDFRGGANGSGVHSFAVKPKGATFELTDRTELIWDILATDIKYGPDSAFYITDWVHGWGRTGKGRIYRLADPSKAEDPLVLETKKLINDGMEKRPLDELARLLAHRDMRVRQEAQFELAARNAAATFAPVAAKSDSQLARLHAIWGLAQLRTVESLPALLADPDVEVRAQAAKVLGDARVAKAFDGLMKLLQDASPRVRFFAAMALGKLGNKQAVPALLEMLRQNADADAYLRHAGAMALAWIGDVKALVAASKDTSPAVRIGAVLALRRLGAPDVAAFLNDADPLVVNEAARAIYDLPIASAMPQLAALVERKSLPDPSLWRAINACYRVGNAGALASFATRPEAPEAMRADALQLLGQWDKTNARDRILGLWRPLVPRDNKAAVAAVRAALDNLLRDANNNVRAETIRLAGQFAIAEASPALFAMVSDPKLSVAVRSEALKALAERNDAKLAEAVKISLADADNNLRAEGIRQLGKIPNAAPQLEALLSKGSVAEQQAVLATLAKFNGAMIDEIFSRQLDQLLAGKLRPELQLDVLEAAAKRGAAPIKEKVARYNSALSKDDPLAPYRVALAGGTAAEGRKIFFERQQVQCVRCHKIAGTGGDVGPDLTQIGARQNREYILESIVNPNAKIAPGFESVLVKLKNGTIETGVLKSDTDTELVLSSADKGLVKVKKSDIETRTKSLSPMPEGLPEAMTKSDLRNLIEFLAGQQK